MYLLTSYLMRNNDFKIDQGVYIGDNRTAASSAAIAVSFSSSLGGLDAFRHKVATPPSMLEGTTKDGTIERATEGSLYLRDVSTKLQDINVCIITFVIILSMLSYTIHLAPSHH